MHTNPWEYSGNCEEGETMAEKFSDEPKAETKVANQTTLAEKTDEYRWVR